MKENSISYKTAKQETERLICEIEEATITHRAYTAECLRRVLKENELLRQQNIKTKNSKYYTRGVVNDRQRNNRKMATRIKQKQISRNI